MSDVRCGRPRTHSASSISHLTSHISHRSRAFTLIEATLSIAITSILLVGMGAALAMTMGTVDTGDDSNARATQASEQLSRLNAELSTATAISAFTPTDIAFTVPDRNNDAVPEKIEYTWSGVKGDPILRIYNGAAPVAWLPGVQSCSLAYADRPAAKPIESSEQVLAQCNTVAGATQNVSTVDSSNYVAQYVRPSFPAGTTSWKITRVTFMGRKKTGNTDPLHVTIRAADAALKPTSTVLASASFTGPSLASSAAWYELLVGPLSGLAPTQGVCIVIDGASGSGTATVAYLQGGSAQPFNTHYMSTSNSGSSWTSPDDTRDLQFILTGTYTTLSEP